MSQQSTSSYIRCRIHTHRHLHISRMAYLYKTETSIHMHTTIGRREIRQQIQSLLNSFPLLYFYRTSQVQRRRRRGDKHQGLFIDKWLHHRKLQPFRGSLSLSLSQLSSKLNLTRMRKKGVAARFWTSKPVPFYTSF